MSEPKNEIVVYQPAIDGKRLYLVGASLKRSREGQTLVIRAELKDGKFMDITRYGVFDKQIER